MQGKIKQHATVLPGLACTLQVIFVGVQEKLHRWTNTQSTCLVLISVKEPRGFCILINFLISLIKTKVSELKNLFIKQKAQGGFWGT